MRLAIWCSGLALVLAACQFDPGGLGEPSGARCGDGVVDPGEQCDDGNTVAGDGCDARCALEAPCGAATCPEGCCDALGACQGGNRDGACGTAGAACVDCAATSLVCTAARTCAAPPPCDPGDLRACGNCGQQLCDAQGEWGPCLDEGVCAPDQVDTGAGCSYCGHEERVCQPSCAWGGWVCVDQGVCLEGAIEVGAACGACGREERACSASCTWDGWECVGADATTYYADQDVDGYGAPGDSTTSCGPAPVGYVAQGGDCNDGNPAIHPGAVEVCGNCADENCDGVAPACDPSASIELSPDPPAASQPLVVTVRSNVGHTCVSLQVRSAGGAADYTSPTVGSGPPYQWTFNIAVGAPGPYTFTFSARPAPCNTQGSPVICRRVNVP